MTAPYAPTLLSPAGGEALITYVNGSGLGTATFRCRYNAPDSLSSHSYTLQRQKLSPSTGSVEYWDATNNVWTATLTWNNVATLEGGDEFEINPRFQVQFHFSAGDVYQWRMSFRNSSLEASTASDWQVFYPVEAIDTICDVESPSSDSRPWVRWYNTTLSDCEQRGYQVAIFDDAIATDSGFDIDNPAWLAQAAWYMNDFEFVDTFQRRSTAELNPSASYKAFVRVIDQYGLIHPWSVAESFTTSLTPPPAPSVTLTPDEANGIMNIQVGAAFNLADVDSAAFLTSLGKWVPRDNVDIELAEVPYESTPAAKVTITGASYDQMDTNHTTYDAEDTAYGTYEDQRLTRSTFTGGGRVWYGPLVDEFIPAIPATDYSSIISVLPEASNISVELVLMFYTAAGAVISETAVTPLQCVAGVWTEVSTGAQTTPANTAWIRPMVEITADVDTVLYLDNFAIAASSSVEWSPGGSSADLKFMVSRKIGDGNWAFVWNASRENPATAQDESYSAAFIQDRGYPIGTNDEVKYRATVFSEATGKVVSSAYTEVVASEMFANAWWIRDTDGVLPDVRLRSEGFEWSYTPANEVFATAGQSYRKIVDTSDAPAQEINVSAYVLDEDEYEKLVALLKSGRRLYIQRNIGDGFYLFPTGRMRFSQRRAGLANDRMRNYHGVSFGAEITSMPDDCTCRYAGGIE